MGIPGGSSARSSSRIGRVSRHGGTLTHGSPANVMLFDPSASRIVDPADSASMSRNTPYRGMELPGAVVATFLRGKPTVLDGKLA